MRLSPGSACHSVSSRSFTFGFTQRSSPAWIGCERFRGAWAWSRSETTFCSNRTGLGRSWIKVGRAIARPRDTPRRARLWCRIAAIQYSEATVSSCMGRWAILCRGATYLRRGCVASVRMVRLPGKKWKHFALRRVAIDWRVGARSV